MTRPFYRREAYRPPADRRFRLSVGMKHYLVVTTNIIGVELEYFTKRSAEPGSGAWRLWLDYADNPDLAGLFHPHFGWDLVGLARLLWAYVEAAEGVYLNGRQDGKLSAPFHLETSAQKWRESDETRVLIRSVLEAAGRPLSRKEIAEQLQKSKHSRLNQLIEQMVKEGELSRSETILKNGKSKYLYTVSPV